MILRSSHDHRDEVVDEREDDQHDREDHDHSDCRRIATMPLAPRRRGSRRGSRRSSRPRRPSAPPGPASSAAARRRRGPSTRGRDRRDLPRRSGRCCVAAFSTPRSRYTTTGRTTTSRTTFPIHQRVIAASARRRSRPCAAMPGSAPRMTSNWALIALTAPSSGRRCSDSTPCSADAERREPLGDPVEAPAHHDQRDGQHDHDDDREHDAQQDQQVRVAHAAPVPVGERVHVAVLDDGLVDDQRQHGRGRLELRDVRRVRGDLAGDLEQAVDRAARCSDTPSTSASSRIATTTAAAARSRARSPSSRWR